MDTDALSGAKEFVAVLPEDFYPESEPRVRFLSDEEGARLRAELPARVDWALVEVAGVQFALEWARDVNLAARTVRGVRRKGRRKELKPYYVPINDDLLAILRAVPSRGRSRWVFPNAANTGPLDPHNWIARVFTSALARARIDGFSWCDLRHTYAMRLRVQANVDTKSIGDLLGHTSGRMAEQRYAPSLRTTSSTPCSASIGTGSMSRLSPLLSPMPNVPSARSER